VRYPVTILLVGLLAGPCLAQAKTSPPKAGPTKTKPPRTAPTQTKTVTKAPPKPTGPTTLSGVYTIEEAKAGKEMYAGLCAGCHTAVSHTGPSFRLKWTGAPLSELFTYIKTMMPKNDPGSLADEDYGVLLAYMLQMNQMPAGKTWLSTDTTELAKIRIDTARTVKRK
jgi:mono/diheme cytochrome c family protein